MALENYKINQDSEGFPLFWNQQVCETLQRDNNCFEKYCIEWKWNRRTRRPATLLTTWSSATKTGSFAKKWKYEPCETDTAPLNCPLGAWYYSTVDPEYFPVPFCGTSPYCEVRKAIKLKDDAILLFYATEFVLLAGSIVPQFKYRRGLADELFNFVEIEGAVINKEKTKLCVLDSLLTKVCVYDIDYINNAFVLQSSWGRFGYQTDNYGFNKPKDIALDLSTNKIIITDTGNACLKVYSIVGKHLNTIAVPIFKDYSPLSVCIDSQNLLHVLLENNTIVVIDWSGNFQFSYNTHENVVVSKILSSYNQEAIYISHNKGVAKYFRTGTFYEDVLYDEKCSSGKFLQNYTGLYQDEMRNLFVATNNKVFKIPDRMKLEYTQTVPLDDLYWEINELLIHKEDYIQPWVYLKAFHRLWDNIELVRTSLPYDATKDQRYLTPVYTKDEITLGQNEIVANSVVNRCINQLWSNIQTLVLYFAQ